jgi:hypothetical protein
MARPLALPEDKPKLSATDKRIDRLMRGEHGRYDELATIEQEREIRNLQSGRDSWDWFGDEDDEGGGDGMHSTI